MSAIGAFEATVSERTREGLAHIEIWTGAGTIQRKSAGRLCMDYGNAVEFARVVNARPDSTISLREGDYATSVSAGVDRYPLQKPFEVTADGLYSVSINEDRTATLTRIS